MNIDKDWRDDFLEYIADENGSVYDLTYQLMDYPHQNKEDHAHCGLCWKTLYGIEGFGFETKGYYCERTNVWICECCFQDYKKRFRWNVQDG